jgi:hypothetical protein
MSPLDQPPLIANSNFHVGHQVAIFVAEEQGFFRDEELKQYEYDARGLIPGRARKTGDGDRQPRRCGEGRLQSSQQPDRAKDAIQNRAGSSRKVWTLEGST